jgi:copper transport protein
MAARAGLRVAVVLLALLGAVSSALAHAQLLSTVPPENALLDTAPKTIALRFNEPVSPLTTRLIGADGQSLDLTAATVGGETVTVSLPDELQRGTQVLSWRVVSTDGHPIGGTLIFSVGEITGAAALEVTSDPAVSVLLWLGKALLFTALFGGVGGAVFGALAGLPVAGRQIATALSLAGLLLAPLTLGLQGLDALGLSLAGLFDAATWSTALSTSYGPTVAALTLGFALAILALGGSGGASRAGAVLAGLIGAAALALSGHASAAAPQWLMRPAVFLHMAGVLFWIGALPPLWLLLRSRTDEADRALAGFSRMIPLAVAPLVLSGLVLAVVQMGPPGASWLTPYGGILAAKLALLALLFGLALWNRRWLTAPALAGDSLARDRLRRSIGAEMTIVLLILGLVAGWRFTPPPRALADVAAATAEPIMAHLIEAQTMVMLTITPGSAGPVAAEIFVGDLEHLPKPAEAVTLTLAAPERGIEPIRREAVAEDGLWRVEGLIIPTAGTWRVEVDVRLGRFELVRPSGEIAIP